MTTPAPAPNPYDVLDFEGTRLPVWKETGRVPLVSISRHNHMRDERFGLPPAEAVVSLRKGESALDPIAMRALGGEIVEAPRAPAPGAALSAALGAGPRIAPDGRDEHGRVVTPPASSPSFGASSALKPLPPVTEHESDDEDLPTTHPSTSLPVTHEVGGGRPEPGTAASGNKPDSGKPDSGKPPTDEKKHGPRGGR